MNKKTAFIFPGQGAQYVGMGKEAYDASPIVRKTFQEASEILGYDIAKLIFEGPESELTATKNSQVAIFVLSAALFHTLEEKPFACAGLSLGEYTALYASGRISFRDCLLLVQARGKYMQEACEKNKGTMRVVLGLEEEKIGSLLEGNVWIANLNCPGQVVIAGELSAVEKASEALTAAGAKRVLPLNVSGAFHTPLMKEAQERLKLHLQNVPLQDSDIALVMNIPGAFVRSLDKIRQFLIDQVASPTRWEKGIRAMVQEGVEEFIEIGPGKTLAGMNKKMGITTEGIDAVFAQR